MISRLVGLIACGLAGLAVSGATLHADDSNPPCGNAEVPCETPLGTYHIATPDTPGPHPAFIYFHGAGGNGARQLDTEWAKTLLERGYAVIAPNGLERPNSRFGPGWFFRPESPGRRNELDFTRQLIADVTQDHGVDPERIVLTGYSIGGSLVWYLACADHELAAAYTPYAGGFWRPHPVDCAGPVKLLHTHGWRDQTVPLEGRPLRNGEIYQGDILEGFQQWRLENGCNLLRADSFETSGRYWRRTYTQCDDGTALEFAIWPGGHVPPDGVWATFAADWVESVLP